MPITEDEHKARHKELHHSLDELVADWITHTGSSSEHPVMELIHWSYEQTIKPTEDK